ncbi:MAG: type II toxin-antitoxin system RelE/ParE family toxin [Phycisphaerales bacterium JB040]
MSGDVQFEFVSTQSFEGSARGLLTAEDLRALELFLLEAPRRGRVIPRTGGFRKTRFARPSRREGKRGGVRVIYYLLPRRARIYLLLVYAKSVKDNLTREEERQLRQIARQLEGESS